LARCSAICYKLPQHKGAYATRAGHGGLGTADWDRRDWRLASAIGAIAHTQHPRAFTVSKPAPAHTDAAANDTFEQHLGSHGRTYNRMADDTRRPSAQSARGEPTAGWGEPSLGGGDQRESVGERLKRERETYGLHLREVSESLRIRYAYLDAIERSAFDELPGPTYAVGFVRGYAQFLGLDDDRIVQRFKEESQGLKRDQELHFPEPVNEGKIPGGTILVLSVLLIAAAYGAWAYLSDGERSVADLVPEVPESLQRMVGATEAPPVPEATDLTGTRTSEPAAGDPAGGEGDGGEGNGGGLAGEQVAELPETAPDPELSGEASPDAPAAPETQTQTAAGAGQGASDTPDGDPDDGAGGTTGTQGQTAATADGTTGTQTQTGTETQAQAQAQTQTGTETGTETAADAAGSGVPNGDVPDAPTTGTTADTAADTTTGTATGTGSAGSQTPTESVEAAQATGEQTQATGEQTQTANQQTQAPDPPEGGGTGPQAQAAARGSDDNPAPPAVPEMQQDDSGIPTAPDQTQTASTQAGGGDGADGRTFGASPGNSRVTLVATARSWVQVRGPDDSLVLTRLLRPGDRYNVPDRQGLTLHTGNAGGLQVMVDGREIGSLGVDGEVRRGILLEPQALSAGG
jgi:cytoskeletal protein RodZ